MDGMSSTQRICAICGTPVVLGRPGVIFVAERNEYVHSACYLPSQRGKRAAGTTGSPPPLILIVEDNADQREMYADYLASEGFRVATASDGRGAIEQAADLRPDLVVMDLSLPQLDGWEATRRLKRHPRTKHVPIIACTGHVRAQAVERALDAGCDAYVTKPCLPEDLAREIWRLLGIEAPLVTAAVRRRYKGRARRSA